jgi:hypothetical protein
VQQLPQLDITRSEHTHNAARGSLSRSSISCLCSCCCHVCMSVPTWVWCVSVGIRALPCWWLALQVRLGMALSCKRLITWGPVTPLAHSLYVEILCTGLEHLLACPCVATAFYTVQLQKLSPALCVPHFF